MDGLLEALWQGPVVDVVGQHREHLLAVALQALNRLGIGVFI